MLRTKKSVFGKGGNCSDFGGNSQAKKCLKRQFADETGEIIQRREDFLPRGAVKPAIIG
jgi:hypothetical protein